MLLLAVMTSAVAMAELTYSTNIDEGGTITIDGTTVSVTPNENYSIESVILYITNRPGILGAGLELPGRKVGDIYIYHVVRDGQVVVTFRPNTDAVHVTFNMNNHGTAILDKELILDQTVDCPNDPTAEGYVFMGWFTDEECTKPYDFNTTLKNSLSFDHTNFYYTLTLYAKWVAESNLYGGCGKVDVEAGLDGSQVTWALSKSDGRVLNRVVFVNLQIALCVDCQVYHAVLANLLQHVVKEPQSGGNVALASTIEIHLDMDVGLLGGTLYFCDSLSCKQDLRDLFPRHIFVAQNQRFTTDVSSKGSVCLAVADDE